MYYFLFIIYKIYSKRGKVLISHIGLSTSLLSIDKEANNLINVKNVGFPNMYNDEYIIKLHTIDGITYTIEFDDGSFMYHNLKYNNIYGSKRRREEIIKIPEYMWEISQDNYGTKIKLKGLCLSKHKNKDCDECFTLQFNNCNNNPDQLWEIFYFPEDIEMSESLGGPINLANA